LAKSGKQVPSAQQIQLLEKLTETLSLLPEIGDLDNMAGLVTETALNLGSCVEVSDWIPTPPPFWSTHCLDTF
jgi:hypothetical protein